MIIECGGSHESGYRDLAKGPIRISIADPQWNAEADVHEALLNYFATQSHDNLMKHELDRQIVATGYLMESLALGKDLPPPPAGRLKRLKCPEKTDLVQRLRIARPAAILP